MGPGAVASVNEVHTLQFVFSQAISPGDTAIGNATVFFDDPLKPTQKLALAVTRRLAVVVAPTGLHAYFATAENILRVIVVGISHGFQQGKIVVAFKILLKPELAILLQKLANELHLKRTRHGQVGLGQGHVFGVSGKARGLYGL
jgi:hypothetical protein